MDRNWFSISSWFLCISRTRCLAFISYWFGFILVVNWARFWFLIGLVFTVLFGGKYGRPAGINGFTLDLLRYLELFELDLD